MNRRDILMLTSLAIALMCVGALAGRIVFPEADAEALREVSMEIARARADGRKASADIASLREQVAAQRRTIISHAITLNELGRSDAAEFAPTELDVFQAVKTQLGLFLLLLDDVQPLANGTRISLRIGNLTSADVGDTTLEVAWSEKSDDESAPSSAFQFTNRKDFQIATQLRTAAWTSANVTLPGVAPDKLGLLEFRLNVNRVSLMRRKD